MLTQHRAQRGLRELAGRFEWIHNLDDGLARIHDPEIDNSVDFDRDVVARDDILLRHVQHDRAQVHPNHLLDDRPYQDESWPLDAIETAKKENNPSLVLAQHVYGAAQQ